MLLGYLFKNFNEESSLPELVNISARKLCDLTANRAMPKPSYTLDVRVNAVSFVANHRELTTYRFHLKGYTDWLNVLDRLSISTEKRAKEYFWSEYKNTADLFFSGEVGQSLITIMPNLPDAFDETYFETTWQYFLDGVYGVCTRDGMPRSIFLKQALVLFVDGFVEMYPDHDISSEHRLLLGNAVKFLNVVESDFAPHEVQGTSRQRCIIDVKAKYRLT
jgi:hypothetical protein